MLQTHHKEGKPWFQQWHNDSTSNCVTRIIPVKVTTTSEDRMMSLLLTPQAVELQECIPHRLFLHLSLIITQIYHRRTYNLFMTVTVILSSKQVDLDDKYQAVLNLKATYTGTESHTLLYKVRTNSKELIDVRPAFGALYRSSDDEAIASLSIRYKGDSQSLTKLKLQISWVWGLLPDEAKRKKLSHQQFTEQYSILKEKMGSEKTQVLLFAMRNQIKQAQQSIIFNEVEVKDNNQSSEEIVVQKDNKTDTKPVSKSTTVAIHELVSDAPKGISIKLVILFVTVFFLLGVFGGMKLQALRASFREEGNQVEKVEGVKENKQADILVDSQIPTNEVNDEQIAKIQQQLQQFSDGDI